MNIENDLRRALRREEPPAGFTERVMALAGVRAEPRREPWWRVRRFALTNALAVTAALLIAVVVYERQEEQRALEARRQLVTALNVTRSSLQKTQERIRRVAAKPIL
jgi:hypothetical protein